MKKPIGSPRSERSNSSNSPWRYAVWGVAALGLIGLFGLLYLTLSEDGLIKGLQQIPGLSRGHDNAVVYADEGLPPAGGVHHDTWQNCGIYDEPIESPKAVHSMEHGAVWITYAPDLPAADVQALQDQVKGEDYILLSPFPGQRSPIVVTAWSVQIEVSEVDDNRIQDFVNTYRLGPTTPERGASCSGGVGEPLF
jgi:hypothetical protein